MVQAHVEFDEGDNAGEDREWMHDAISEGAIEETVDPGNPSLESRHLLLDLTGHAGRHPSGVNPRDKMSVDSHEKK